MESNATQEEILKTIQHLFRSDEIDYRYDSIYGAAILLDSFLNEDLTLEDALEEFIDNSDVELGVRHR